MGIGIYSGNMESRDPDVEELSFIKKRHHSPSRNRRDGLGKYARCIFVFTLLVLTTSLWTISAYSFGSETTRIAAIPVDGPSESQTSLNTDEVIPETLGGHSVKHDDFGKYVDCPGNSSQEYRASGCFFDVLLFGWIPGPCFDEAMYQHHARPGSGYDYGYYLDEVGTEGIPQTALMEGDFERYPEAYVSDELHWQHCNYLLNTSVAYRWRNPSVFLNMHLHQEHMSRCLQYATDPTSSRSIQVNAELPKADFTARRRCYLG